MYILRTVSVIQARLTTSTNPKLQKISQKSNLEREYDIPVKSVENIEVKEEPSAEKVYSDLNLPEIINDVRLLRQEINGARRSFKILSSKLIVFSESLIEQIYEKRKLAMNGYSSYCSLG